jgi:hypothetical protein
VTTEPTGADIVADHLANCAGAGAALVMQSGSADDLIVTLLAAGWTWSDRPTEVVAGKRIRYLTPPPDVAERILSKRDGAA